MRPLEKDCTLQLLKFDAPEAKKVFWHSSSHILGQALELKFRCNLGIGPALKPDKGGGFYYDMCPEQSDVYVVVPTNDYSEILSILML